MRFIHSAIDLNLHETTDIVKQMKQTLASAFFFKANENKTFSLTCNRAQS